MLLLLLLGGDCRLCQGVLDAVLWRGAQTRFCRVLRATRTANHSPSPPPVRLIQAHPQDPRCAHHVHPVTQVGGGLRAGIAALVSFESWSAVRAPAFIWLQRQRATWSACAASGAAAGWCSRAGGKPLAFCQPTLRPHPRFGVFLQVLNRAAAGSNNGRRATAVGGPPLLAGRRQAGSRSADKHHLRLA